MVVTDEHFARFRAVYASHDDDVPQSMRAALEDFCARQPSTSTVQIVGDVLKAELQPQRDYRKEMWIAAWNDYSGAPARKTGWADEALNEFDKRFPS